MTAGYHRGAGLQILRGFGLLLGMLSPSKRRPSRTRVDCGCVRHV